MTGLFGSVEGAGEFSFAPFFVGGLGVDEKAQLKNPGGDTGGAAREREEGMSPLRRPTPSQERR